MRHHRQTSQGMRVSALLALISVDFGKLPTARLWSTFQFALASSPPTFFHFTTSMNFFSSIYLPLGEYSQSTSDRVGGLGKFAVNALAMEPESSKLSSVAGDPRTEIEYPRAANEYPRTVMGTLERRLVSFLFFLSGAEPSGQDTHQNTPKRERHRAHRT